MELALGNGIIWVRLSRKNLETLLAKLNDPDSKRTIIRDFAPGFRVLVTAEENDIHYGDRTPGVMKEDLIT